MLCPKCKNPLNDNSAICEWCGNIIAHNNVDKKETKDFNTEIIGLLNGAVSYNGKTGVAALIPYTQNKYNCKPIEAKYRIAKWEYFSKNPNANLLDWKRYTIKMGNKFGALGFFSLLTVIGIIAAINFYKQSIMWGRFQLMTDKASCNSL